MTNPNQSIVAQWNEVMLEAIREGSAKPTATTYQLHLVTAAVYDAWAAFDDDGYGHYSEISTNLDATEDNKAEALSFAAYQMLSTVLPEAQAKYDAFMAELGYDINNSSTDPETAAGLGNLAAQNVLDAREDDGSNFENDFADTTDYEPVNDPEPGSPGAPGGDDFDPNAWQPLRVPNGTLTDGDGVPTFDNNDPSTFDDQEALTPHWGEIESFALSSGDQFRPPAPPQLGDFTEYVDGLGNVTTGDQAYRDQTTEVLEVSAGLTTEEKVIAEFWADGPRTESPPGHWNQIAQDIALREEHGIDEDAKLFFAVNAAIFDAGIATWEAKYHYNYVRPQSAIRDLFFDQAVDAWGGPNQGTQEILGQEWQPYQNVTFVTPPFPEFVSGHSTFSMAAAKTIAAFVGTDAFYDGETLGNYDLDNIPGTDLLGEFVATELSFEDYPVNEGPVVLQWDTLTEAAEEAGASRIFGGIHIQDGNLRGLEVGEQVAANAQNLWEALFTRGGDDFVISEDGGNVAVLGSGDDSFRDFDGRDDNVEAGSGNDKVRGEVGEDTIRGEEGADDLRGGADADVIYGGDDDDYLLGGDGNDMIFGGNDNDHMFGGADDDLMFGDDGNDNMRGDDGNDLLVGGIGEDRMNGGDDEDTLIGGEDDDSMRGGDDDDILAGGDGSDKLRGDGGGDQFVFFAGETGLDSVNDFGNGADEVVLVGFGAGAAVSLTDQQGDLLVSVDGTDVAVLRDTDAADINIGTNLTLVDVFGF